MPCYQSTNLPSGVTTTGRTSYKTEAECNQACREGACCEGTTCSVKPQCQCKCASGSCCGPDTYTNVTNETGPRCRTESQADCTARGGTWRCGVPCRGVAYDPAAGYGLGSNICSSLDATPSTTPVFKGVGTVCAGTGVCCKPSQLATATGVKKCVPVETICDCASAGDVLKETSGITCETANCTSCPCTAMSDYPVSITVRCQLVRKRANRACPDDLNYPAFFSEFDYTFTETLYFKQKRLTCQGAEYYSVNQKRWSSTTPSASSTDGLDANGVYLSLQSESGRCSLRGWFNYYVYSRNSAGEIRAGELLGTPGGSVVGAVGGNDKFWDNSVGQEIYSWHEGPSCYPTYRVDCTMRIVSLNYLP
jgi:hypothetical protein